jgi:hypothetical protein
LPPPFVDADDHQAASRQTRVILSWPAQSATKEEIDNKYKDIQQKGKTSKVGTAKVNTNKEHNRSFSHH